MKKIKELVRQVIVENEKAREDDFVLIYEVVDKITGCAKFMMFADIRNSHLQYRIPSFESITRARRNIQKEMPELKVKRAVEIRAEEEKKYKEEYRR